MDNIEVDGEALTMDDLMKEEITRLEAGSVVTGRYLRKGADGYFFDVGQKREALVLKEENVPDDLLNDDVKLLIENPSSKNHHGYALASYRKIVKKDAIVSLREAWKNQTPVTGIVTASVKGGYAVDLGAEGFCV